MPEKSPHNGLRQVLARLPTSVHLLVVLGGVFGFGWGARSVFYSFTDLPAEFSQHLVQHLVVDSIQTARIDRVERVTETWICLRICETEPTKCRVCASEVGRRRVIEDYLEGTIPER